jgi:hypothetical protein
MGLKAVAAEVGESDVKSSKIKPILGVVAAGLLLLLGVNYIAGENSFGQPPLGAALAECREKGWQDHDLGLSSSEVSSSCLGSTASIVLKSKDPNQPKTVRVQLRRWINLLGWDVVDYKEE